MSSFNWVRRFVGTKSRRILNSLQKKQMKMKMNTCNIRKCSQHNHLKRMPMMLWKNDLAAEKDRPCV